MPERAARRLQAEGLAEHGRLDPAGGFAGGGEALGTVLVDVEPRRFFAGVDQPILTDVGLPVSPHLPFRVLVLRAVADDFDDQVRRTFHGRVPALTTLN